MNRNRNQNILLVEIMIAVLFFALCSTVMLETFVASREYTGRSSRETEALVEMQNITERLYAAEDAALLLEEAGYLEADGQWSREYGDFGLTVTLKEEETAAGILRSSQIRAFRDGKEIAAVPGARYFPGGEAE